MEYEYKIQKNVGYLVQCEKGEHYILCIPNLVTPKRANVKLGLVSGWSLVQDLRLQNHIYVRMTDNYLTKA